MDLKKVFFLILFALPFLSLAQQDKILHYQKIDHKPFHFGYTLGINTMDFSIYPSEHAFKEASTSETVNDFFPEVNRLSPGVDIGIVTNFRMGEYLDFRLLPGISLGQRNLLFYDNVTHSISNNEAPYHEMKIGSTFINLPFSIRYEAQRENNYRPYLIGGVNFRWDMARNKDFNSDEGIFIKLRPFDVYVEGGFGIDFYLPYFKLSTEIKYSVGTMNVISPDKDNTNPGYASSIDKLKSRVLSISFHFE